MKKKSRKRGIRMAALTTLLLCLCGCAVQPAEPCAGICYKISGGKNEMFLLGSIHVGNQDMSVFGSSIRQAMENADVFVFECDTQSREARRVIQEMTQAQTPLKEAISPSAYALAEQAAKRLGLPMSRLDGLRPWAVASQLSGNTAAAELGVDNANVALSLGVEETVRKAVGNRTTAYLETPEEQLRVLDSFSPALQEEMLTSVCRQLIDPQPTSLKSWPEWWRLGDAEAFATAYQKENQLSDPELTEEYHQGLVTRRNQTMAERLKAMLEGDEPHNYFVTVGLLHLVLEEDSLPSLLREAGYNVERVTQALPEK